tara:strand:- start:834 stop:1841 length:1008 start_codon:yes stop_codon:yes gene_type:complete
MKESRTILITGASSGIGYQATLDMLRRKNHVIAPCKNKERSTQTFNRLKKELYYINDLDKKLFVPCLDLSKISSINSFVNQLKKSFDVIDSLVLNAGMQYTGSNLPRWSFEGIELTFAVNHLSHQYLTQLLIQLLYKSSNPRIIITSSEVHNPDSPGGSIGEPAHLGKLEGLFAGKGFKMLDGKTNFNADKAYKDSKLCNILFARELSKRLSSSGREMPILAWAPGLVIPRSKDGFFRYSREYNQLGQTLFAIIARDILRITETESKAGNILADLSIEDEYDHDGFRYFSNRLVRPGKKVFEESRIGKEASDELLAFNLWEKSCELTGTPSELNS